MHNRHQLARIRKAPINQAMPLHQAMHHTHNNHNRNHTMAINSPIHKLLRT